MCDCIAVFNERSELRDANTQILERFVMQPDGSLHAEICIETIKLDPKKRGKTHNVLASFCPFCGKPYPSTVRSQQRHALTGLQKATLRLITQEPCAPSPEGTTMFTPGARATFQSLVTLGLATLQPDGRYAITPDGTICLG